VLEECIKYFLKNETRRMGAVALAEIQVGVEIIQVGVEILS
jgi:hypothetical protein